MAAAVAVVVVAVEAAVGDVDSWAACVEVRLSAAGVTGLEGAVDGWGEAVGRGLFVNHLKKILSSYCYCWRLKK